METMTTTKYASVSHPSACPTAATRTTQPAASQQSQQHLSAPASQESFVSVQSTGSSIAPPKLQTSDSNLSQLTTYTDAELTSPLSSAASKTSFQNADQLPSTSQIRRVRTPEDAARTPYLNGESAFASPMSITSPVATNGAKRTASGHVKNAPSLPNTPYGTTFPGRDSRRESTSSSGSRAGELAATLKTRLGYAMAKVQHGWEHKSLQEIEQLAAEKARSSRHSISHVDYQRPATNGLTNGTPAMSMYDQYGRGAPQSNGPPPSKRHSGAYPSYMHTSQQPVMSYAAAPRLQPALDLRPTSASRKYPAQQLAYPSSQSNAMSPPRTPVNATPRRPPTIRTETQTKDAEMDALQALIGLGSPHMSQVPQSATTTSSQASPQKMNLDTPRRVTFARSESNSSARPSSSGSSAPSRAQMSATAEELEVQVR